MCYLAIIYTLDNDSIGGIIAPVFLCFLLSFWVASMFLEIFGMGIETILYCFIADEEMFALEDRFAGRELVGTLATAQIMHTHWKARKNKVSEEVFTVYFIVSAPLYCSRFHDAASPPSFEYLC